MPRKETYGGSISAQAQQDLVSEGIENFELPRSLVMKIAKSAVPESVKLQKETVLSLVKGSTVFINYLAATAHDVAQSRQHKSISASDVIKALELMQFRSVSLQCQHELNVYRELAKQAEAKSSSKKSTSTSAPAVTKKNSNGAIPSSASASVPSKGKGKERAVPAVPLPSPFTSTALPHSNMDEESAPQPESISAETENNAPVPMDLDTWADTTNEIAVTDESAQGVVAIEQTVPPEWVGVVAESSQASGGGGGEQAV